MTSKTYALQGLHCKACIGRVTEKLAPLAEGVNVTLDPMQVVLTNPLADVATLQTAVAEAGKYQLLASLPDAVTPTPSNTAWTEEEQPASWLATYSPLLMIIAFILGAALLVQWGHGGVKAITLDETMRYFMAGFFLVFSFFKLLDINAFADAYTGYDLLAQRWRGWALIYPFVELALGMAYLAHLDGPLVNWVTVAVMGFSAIGVIQAVTNRRRIQCACLGAVFKLPMSTVTIVEDLGMVAMALWMVLAAS